MAFAGGDGSAPLDPLDPVRVVSPISIIQSDGVKVGEGTSIYPQVGLETGYVSNVFYTNDSPVGAGLLRLIAEVGAGSLSPQRRHQVLDAADNSDAAITDTGDLTSSAVSNQGAFQYSANAYATWDQYLSGNSKVTAQGGLGLGLYLNGLVHPGRPLSLRVLENYDRILRAANFETTKDTNRDVNNASLQLKYQPPGRTLSGDLTYTNTIDVFEDSTYQVSDRIENTLALRVNWRFLPLTQTYAQVSEGLFTGLGSQSEKVTSYPLTAVVGINTDLTVKTALIARVGYTQGFYTSGPDYATVTGGALFDYHYSPVGRLRIFYDYEHSDSINANFYRDHVLQAWFEQSFQPVSIFVSPEVRFRQYQGLLGTMATAQSVRNDTIVAAAVGLRFQLRHWLVGSAQYLLTVDQTDYRYMTGGVAFNPSYVRHEVTLGLRAAL